ncbi:hypothetical protein ACPPVT_14355 [Angustibacter sp. McL0619]|uniref:hypothetical protein n=1 Tax=Angustibacter sp. McL0619 TaxID=3415676 RepID=UPI003CE991C6
MTTLFVTSAQELQIAADSPAGKAPGFLNGDSITGLMIFAFSVILSFIAVRALLKHGAAGNIKGASNVTVASLICAIPLALAVTAGWYSIAADSLSFFTNS